MDQPTLAELHALLARRDQGPRGLLGLDATPAISLADEVTRRTSPPTSSATARRPT